MARAVRRTVRHCARDVSRLTFHVSRLTFHVSTHRPHPAMSLSDVVDRRYRLNAAALEGRVRSAIVCSVSYEGVEDLRPLIRFEGLGRPLALDPVQRLDMARITHSTLLADWVGASVLLRPVRSDGHETIRLVGVEELERLPRWVPPAPPRPSLPLRALLRILAVTFLIVAAFAAANFVERLPNFQALLDVLLK